MTHHDKPTPGSNDPLAFLATLRPESPIASEWDRATSTAVLDRILDSPRDAARRSPSVRVRRGRWAVAGLVAAGAAAAAVVSLVLPAGSPGGPDPAAAAALRELAVVAGQQGGTVGSGQYAYTALAEEQTADDLSQPPLPGETRVGDVDRRPRLDVWLAPSGVRWAEVGEQKCLRRSVYTGADAERGVYEDLTGPQLAALPTDTSKLAAFFDAHPAGDNRGTRNRFLSVGDLVRSGLAAPQLRAAALRVLADTDGLTVRPAARDERGRKATAVSFTEGTSVETLFFDPATSAVLESRQTLDGKGGHYSGIVLASGVVDRLPNLPRCKGD